MRPATDMRDSRTAFSVNSRWFLPSRYCCRTRRPGRGGIRDIAPLLEWPAGHATGASTVMVGSPQISSIHAVLACFETDCFSQAAPLAVEVGFEPTEPVKAHALPRRGSGCAGSGSGSARLPRFLVFDAELPGGGVVLVELGVAAPRS